MFEAWQAQQKAQKDEDRKAKSAAAAALQSYRRDGLSEEETKLAILREQERLQKLEAEQKLRNYRGQMSEEEARLFAQRQEELRKKQLMEEQLRNNGVVTANQVGVHASLRGIENSGAVSAIAAQYTSNQKEEQQQQEQEQSSQAIGTKSSSAESMVPDASFCTQTQIPFTTNGEEYDTSVPLETEKTMLTEASMTPVPPVSPIASQVSFVFGILTASDMPPQVDGYLAKADQIVKTIVAENPNNFVALAPSLTYPTVKSIEKDFARTDANRFMVTVSIDFTAPTASLVQDFQRQVVEAIRIAIANGTFTKE
ncbi:hypothetical protein IV203_007366 [Nitzschia inconspicua]|uniref:Uncharacterized protein n=1 Tax=Nitzschia inconspicua TaxID=303405 RepID=A0A9K3KEI8_9STRA|nr:hypothetical protein IV203_007366 [Nitzschia inconspicua]